MDDRDKPEGPIPGDAQGDTLNQVFRKLFESRGGMAMGGVAKHALMPGDATPSDLQGLFTAVVERPEVVDLFQALHTELTQAPVELRAPMLAALLEVARDFRSEHDFARADRWEAFARQADLTPTHDLDDLPEHQPWEREH